MIKIDKRKGRFNLKDANELDNYAYWFHIIKLKENINMK